MNTLRKIIHVDMDAFYASVEQLDNPELKGKPIAVGGNEIRGVVSAASYEARAFGVRSAMSGKLAAKRCPQLIFVKPRFERYKEISLIIRSIFLKYTDLVEPLAFDEAYLDVTVNKVGINSASKIARLIREEIFKTTGLTASAGISTNKFIAKIASDINKPNGQKTIIPDNIESFIENLEIKKFYGIGSKTCQKMYQLGIFTGKDLKSKSLEFLIEHFNNSGKHYYNLSRGIHTSEVKPDRLPKSIGAERTFDYNISSALYLEEKLQKISEEVAKRLVAKNIKGKTITLKIKYSDFTQQTRSYTTSYFINDSKIIFNESKNLLHQCKLENSVRLIGIQVSNLDIHKQIKKEYVQLKFNF